MTTAAVTANSAQLHHRAERCSACFLKGVAMRFNFGAFLFADGAQKLAKKVVVHVQDRGDFRKG
jgi:hypothetical protein